MLKLFDTSCKCMEPLSLNTWLISRFYTPQVSYDSSMELLAELEATIAELLRDPCKSVRN